MSTYHDFLSQKHKSHIASGFDIELSALNPMMFKYQRDITQWALKLGRAALFLECGLGKTLIQLEWARHVHLHTGLPVLILAPLVVAFQTVQEGQKFGIQCHYAQDQEQAEDHPLVITNYERLAKFDPSHYAGVVLDESSILKAFSGITKRAILQAFGSTPYRLACTATPAPNDHLELGNHAEFLGVMPSNEMIARWFINDTMKAGNYRLKGHAEKDFWRWLTSWSVGLSHPADLGAEYDLPGFTLPPLRIHEHLVEMPAESIARAQAEGKLFPDSSPSSTKLHGVKRESLRNRVDQALAIAAAFPTDAPFVIWCDTNYEADLLQEVFPDALEVRGSDSIKHKEDALLAFSTGKAQILITKPDIAGWGLNWQAISRHIFVGVSYSFEKFYQAIRRSYRFGQQSAVDIYVIYAETESEVLTTLKRKQEQFAVSRSSMTAAVREYGLVRDSTHRKLATAVGSKPMHIPSWLQPHHYSV